MSTAAAPFLFPLSSLPEELPVFPLSGVVLLPRSRLPLNVFEHRYLAMVDDALMAPGRLIGIIQPNSPDEADNKAPPLYKVGCAGRINSFSETEDGRYLIGLTGICRFNVLTELPAHKLYRTVRPDWQQYLEDISPLDEVDIDRKRLLPILQSYFKLHGISADWEVVENTETDLLISSLVMICPFAPNEKQALLESPNVTTRANLLMALLEMAMIPPQGEVEGGARH
jgi:Lon protease-like protein